jgi:hypothetical protein
MRRIYIAGPYTNGDVAINVRRAILAANDLADRGFAPFVPHLTHFWHLLIPRPYQFWLDLDMQFLSCCEALLRLSGVSLGADTEVAEAQQQGMPVFWDIDALDLYFKGFDHAPAL